MSAAPAGPSPALPQSWTADWITVPEHRRDDLPAPLFRKQWDLPSPIERAVLHVSGQGDADVTLNGRHPDESRLGPGQSDHSVVARATSVDVSDQLAGQQQVVAGIELGRAFFDLHTPEVWRWSTAPWRDSVRLTFELHVDLADGSHQVLTSDDSWRTGTGGTRFDSLYEGESWDADAEPAGWREPGFDDSSWDQVRVLTSHPKAGQTHHRAAREIATSGLPLRQAMADPILVQETIDPEWTQQPDGSWVGDIGRVVGGWVKVTALTEDPVEFTVTHGERLADDGSVIAENQFIPTGRFQRDDVRLRGGSWEARHTWKGFRYLQVRGAQIGSQVQVQAQVAYADVPLTGGFRTSHPTLDWLNQAFVNTVHANFHWVPTDTPTYEKNGWTGDAQVALPAMLARFDLANYFTSWLDDFLDSQLPDGALPVIIPTAGWGYGGGECAPAPEWTTLYPVLVDALVREYGLDLWPIHRDGVIAYLDWELRRLDDDGLAVGILGDYLSPGTGGPPPEDIRIESTIYLRNALLVTAAALPDDPRAADLVAAADQLAAKVNELFLDRGAGAYASGALGGSTPSQGVGYRQTPNLLALDAGIVPAELADQVLANLVADIVARGDHHHVGCLGTSRLSSLLVRRGHGDLALRVASNPTAPSWESWRLAGHQTLLEMWVEPVRSRAHYFLGSGARFLEDDVAGLQVLEPRLARVRIAPIPVPGLDEWTLTRGPLTIRRGADDQGEALWVSLPEDSTAEVVLAGQTHEQSGGEQRYDWPS